MSSLLYIIRSSKLMPFCLHNRYYQNIVVQTNFTKTKNGISNTTGQTSKSNDKTSSLEEILNSVPPESEALSPSDTFNIFRKLSEASRNPKISSTPYNVVEHKNFDILRQAIKVSLPYLQMAETFEVLKAIQRLSLPTDDAVSIAIHSMLIENVFRMSLNEIMITNLFLKPSKKCQLAVELQRQLVNKFNVKTSQFPVKFNYFMKTRRLLQFIERNENEITDEVFINMEKCASQQPIDIFTAYEAMDIIITLASFGNRSEYLKKILEKAFSIWCSKEVTIQMVEMVLICLISRKSTLNYNLYTDSRFIETCAQVAIVNGDVEKCFLILKQLNLLELSSQRLIDFLLDYLSNEKCHKNHIHNYISICIACDIANYRPDLINEFVCPTIATLNLQNQFDIPLNWPKFALRLHRLGIYHTLLINEILRQKSHFRTFDADNIAELESLQMEKLVNADINGLLPDFKQSMGEDKLRLLVYAENGVIIPLLLKIDIHSRKCVPFENAETNSLSSIRCDDNQSLVAVIRTRSQDVRYSRPDVTTIVLNSLEWTKLLNHRTQEEMVADIDAYIENQKSNQNCTKNMFQ